MTEVAAVPGHFDVISSSAFLDHFSEYADTLKDLLFMQGTYLHKDRVGSVIGKILADAANRGVRTHLVLDSYGLMTSENRVNRDQEMLEDLKDHGVVVEFTNPPQGLARIIPATGRNHIKGIRGDKRAYIGGLNYGEGVFNSSDFEVVIDDLDIVDALEFPAPSSKKIAEGKDYEVDLGETKILVDIGKVGQSCILDREVNMIDEELDIIRVTNPLFPDGPERDALQRAKKRGVEVQVITSAIAPWRDCLNNFILAADLATRAFYAVTRDQLPVFIHNNGLHGKLCLTQKKVLWGSHNFNWKGIVAGTQERSIQSSNPHLVANLNRYFDGLLESSRQI